METETNLMDELLPVQPGTEVQDSVETPEETAELAELPVAIDSVETPEETPVSNVYKNIDEM